MIETGLRTIYDARLFEDNFPPGVERHFWFRARNALLDRALRGVRARGLLREGACILEVGCGTGIAVRGLRKAGHDVIGAELGRPVPMPDAAPFMVTGTRAQDLDPATRARIGALLFLDVIEHVPDDTGLLRDTRAAFPNCTCVVVTVPARPEVWSRHDAYYGHFRRYTPDMLRGVLRAADLRPVVTRSLFHSLYGAAALMKLAGRDRDPIMRAPGNAALHGLLAAALTVESRLLGATPLPGLSLLAVAATTAARG